MTTTASWASGGGGVPNQADFAIIEVEDRKVGTEIKKIGEVVGSLGYRTSALMPNHTKKVGYPATARANRWFTGELAAPPRGGSRAPSCSDPTWAAARAAARGSRTSGSRRPARRGASSPCQLGGRRDLLRLHLDRSQGAGQLHPQSGVPDHPQRRLPAPRRELLAFPGPSRQGPAPSGVAPAPGAGLVGQAPDARRRAVRSYPRASLGRSEGLGASSSHTRLDLVRAARERPLEVP